MPHRSPTRSIAHASDLIVRGGPPRARCWRCRSGLVPRAPATRVPRPTATPRTAACRAVQVQRQVHPAVAQVAHAVEQDHGSLVRGEERACVTSPAPAEARGAKRAGGRAARGVERAGGDANVPETALEAAYLEVRGLPTSAADSGHVATWRKSRGPPGTSRAAGGASCHGPDRRGDRHRRGRRTSLCASEGARSAIRDPAEDEPHRLARQRRRRARVCGRARARDRRRASMTPSVAAIHALASTRGARRLETNDEATERLARRRARADRRRPRRGESSQSLEVDSRTACSSASADVDPGEAVCTAAGRKPPRRRRPRGRGGLRCKLDRQRGAVADDNEAERSARRCARAGRVRRPPRRRERIQAEGDRSPLGTCTGCSCDALVTTVDDEHCSPPRDRT